MKNSNVHSVVRRHVARIVLLGSIATILLNCQKDDIEITKGSPPPPADVSEQIRFGVYAADKASRVVEDFAPTLRMLESSVSEKLNRKVKIRMEVASEYGKGISALVTGKVHFSRLGPASFITAKEQNADLELLAMESKKGARTFNGIIAIHGDSEIGSLEELKGKSFAFGDPLSTIGRFLSQSELLNAGLKGSDFSKFDYLGRHDTVGMAVVAGDYTAGALKESTFKALVDGGHPIKALKKFDNVTKPWVAHPSLDPDILEALRSSLLELKGSSISKDGFLTASDFHYDAVREAMTLAQNFDS